MRKASEGQLIEVPTKKAPPESGAGCRRNGMPCPTESVEHDQFGRDDDFGAREPVERVHPVEEAFRGHDAELLVLDVDERRNLLEIMERMGPKANAG